jgi:two-component system, cell cycle sensor histidine kinase and response regulator CckA
VNSSNKQILVVDNNPLILRLMDHFLSGLGHRTTCAGDAFACLDALADLTPDLIFIDVVMPRIGGEDLCRILRSMERLDHCYLVILSGVALEQQLDFRRLGADALIAKGPFAEMRLHLQEVLAMTEKPRQAQGNHLPAVPHGADHLHFRQISGELLHNNQHLRVILEGMSQGLLELCQGRVAYINPKASLILGLPRERLLGRPLHDLVPAPLLDALAELAADTSQQQASSTPLSLGSYQVLVEAYPLAGSPPSTIILFSDITERRQMEAVIEAANLTKNLGYVFSGIRHEIGNPVNSIKMALSVLRKNLDDYDRDTVALFLDRSLQEVTRLEYLLRALKNYSLFERPQIGILPIAAFLRDFLALAQKDMEAKQIRLRAILPDENLCVLADGRALHHVMLNLITNAADALDRCTNPQILVSARQAGRNVEIKVDDNGCGIANGDRQHLFQPFFTSKPGGTGLGLVIVKKMLLAMNGRINLESYVGMGTTATIFLPGVEP